MGPSQQTETVAHRKVEANGTSTWPVAMASTQLRQFDKNSSNLLPLVKTSKLICDYNLTHTSQASSTLIPKSASRSGHLYSNTADQQG